MLRRPLAPARGERLGVLALGFVGYGGESTLYFLGLERGSAAAVSLLFYTNPGIVMLLQWAFGHRKPQRSALLAFGVALCGVVLVAVDGVGRVDHEGGSGLRPRGCDARTRATCW